MTGRALAVLVSASVARPGLTVVLSAALALVSAVYTVRTLGFVTDPLRLLPQQARYVVLLRDYQRDFGELNDVVVAIEAPAPATAQRFATRLAGILGPALPDAQLTYRIDPAWIDRRGLLYLSTDELTRLRDRLLDYEELVTAYAERPTLTQLLEGLNGQIAAAIALGFMDLGLGGERDGDLRFLEALVDQIGARLAGPAPYVSPWATAFSSGPLDTTAAGWFFSPDRRLLFFLVQPPRETGDLGQKRAMVGTIRSAVQSLARDFPDVRAGVTGAPAIATDEMTTALADSEVAGLLAFAATLGLLLFAFRRVVSPLLMLLTLQVSLVWSLAIAALVVGHLNIFSVMFISIVVGIGIDYGIYVLYGQDDERAVGVSQETALVRMAEDTGPGILLGALTAAGTFFVLMLTEFQGIREFGFVAGAAVLASFVAMLTLFPALLTLDRRWRRRASVPAPPTGAMVPEPLWLRRLAAHKWTILVGAAGCSALALWLAQGVEFDENMLRMQAKGVESVVWEERVVATAGRSAFSALTTASTVEELRRKQEAFAALPSVAQVESLLRLVPDRQPEKAVIIRQLAPVVAPIQMSAVPAFEAESLRAPLTTLRRRLGLAVEGAEEAGRQPVAVRAVRDKLDGIIARLGTVSTEGTSSLGRLQSELADDFADKLRTFQRGVDPAPIAPGDLPAELRHRYIGQSGRLLLRIHPGVDIWQREGAARFVGDLRRVDPDVTGPPVTAFESIRLIRRAYFEGTLCAVVLVTLVTGVMLWSVRGTLLALVPLVLGVVWTLGLMHVLDLRFTLANVWALPLIIGSAVEYGGMVVVRFVQQGDESEPLLPRSAVMSVVLNGLTTMTGFSSLMVAHHRGIFGLGLLLTIGSTVSLIASLVVLPALLLRYRAEPSRDQSGTTLASR
jgi:hopanoid biosynthesis associated RND transporter like protein HpnN